MSWYWITGLIVFGLLIYLCQAAIVAAFVRKYSSLGESDSFITGMLWPIVLPVYTTIWLVLKIYDSTYNWLLRKKKLPKIDLPKAKVVK